MDAFTLVAKLILDKGEFNAGIKGAEDSLNSDEHKGAFSAWGAAMGQLAARAIETAVRAGLNFAKSVLDVGMNFDAQMSYVQSIGQMTDEELETVRNKALQLGESTQFTAEQVGQAFGYMALAGWDAEEMLSGIDGILSLAAASGEDLGLVSDIVTDALTAFGLEAEDAGHFVNVLAAASANSNTTVAQMGEAFKYLATTGGLMGYTIDDVAVALGLLANNGTKASMAGTSMRMILQTLAAPTEDVADAMNALGISLFEFGSDKRKPLMQVMEEMREAFKNSGFNLEGQDAQEAMSRWLAYYQDWTKKVAELDKEYQEGSLTKKDYDEQMKTLNELYDDNYMAILKPNERFLEYIKAIGGTRGLGSLIAIMKTTEGDLGQLVDSVNASDEGMGAAGKMAETMIDNLRGDITILNSALDGLKILISDEYKGAFRDFVQMITAGIGEMSDAFSEGGMLGLFTNLTDWIINGITDTLTNPEITGSGAQKFGKALGDFVGHLVSTLITSAPELLGGLFEAGINLAGGLVEGLFAGLFGTGDASVYGMISRIEDEKNDAVADAEKTAVKATGIVAYMNSLVEKYGEAATQTEEWAVALGDLKEVLPGVTDILGQQYNSVSDLTTALKDYIQMNKEAAVASASEKAVKQYEEELAQATAEQAIAAAEAESHQYQQQSARDAMMAYVQDMWQKAGNEGTFADYVAAMGGDVTAYSMKELNDIALGLMDQWYMNQQAFAETNEEMDLLNQSYKSQQTMMTRLVETYEQEQKAAKDSADKANELAERAEKAAVQLKVAQDALAHLAGSAETYADGLDGGTGAEPEGSHAKGLNYVPYDNYVANLHRGEMVLNQNQARNYRNGMGGGVDGDALYRIIADAVAGAVEGIQINMDGTLVGNAVTKQVSRNIYQQQFSRRFV